MPDTPNARPDRCNGTGEEREHTMNTTERCSDCNGHGEVPSGYSRFGSALSAWEPCDDCNGTGRVVIAAEPETAPGFASYDDFARYYADDLRDAMMEAS